MREKVQYPLSSGSAKEVPITESQNMGLPVLDLYLSYISAKTEGRNSKAKSGL